MSAPIPSSEPTSAVSGDTISWTKSLADFPAPTWTLTYAFRVQHGAGKHDVTATASGSDHAATITAAQSALMKAGVWSWAAYVTQGTERYQVGTGTLTLAPNLATIDYTTDLRSPAKRAYDNALEAWEKVTLGQTVTLNGRTYTQHDLRALLVYVDRCKSDYHRELQAEQIAKTGINPRRIGVRTVRV